MPKRISSSAASINLSRNEDIQAKLGATDWDVIVCDEAHKMPASFLSGEVKATQRYKLGQLLGKITHHFLLLTATPHNGKEEDFQLFMAPLDADHFEGRFRDGVHQVDTSDLMRQMTKEQFFKFDGTPQFPRSHKIAIMRFGSGAQSKQGLGKVRILSLQPPEERWGDSSPFIRTK